MPATFTVDYVAFPHHHGRLFTYQSNDPVETEDFLMHLLLVRARITEIRHNGAPLVGHAFDRMLKVAADRLAGELLRESLGIDPVQIRDRFGYAA
ncbi:hypothetical protein GALL_164550 [mine drainage metagenome]|uniref:Uncharacterized protein n=1 Tax=mine drainage metagenome TaxID=410659 RepID=A0A1J5RZG6_9ZZZZ